MTQDSSGRTGYKARAQSHAELLTCTEIVSGLSRHRVVDGFRASLVDGKLSNGVRDLLRQDREEARIQRPKTLGGQNFGKARDKSVGVLGRSAKHRTIDGWSGS